MCLGGPPPSHMRPPKYGPTTIAFGPMRRRIMNSIQTLSGVILLSLAAGAMSASAQDTQKAPDFMVGRKGEAHFYVPVRVGSTILQPGTYEVEHILDGSDGIVSVHDHAISFRKMGIFAGYRSSNKLRFKEPTATLKCKLGEATTTVPKTTVTLRTNAAGEKEIAEVQIAGEAFKHVF